MTTYGAFVDFGARNDGLVHISQLSHSFVRDVNDVVQVGQAIECKVISIDLEKGRTSLSLKGLNGDEEDVSNAHRQSVFQSRFVGLEYYFLLLLSPFFLNLLSPCFYLCTQKYRADGGQGAGRREARGDKQGEGDDGEDFSARKLSGKVATREVGVVIVVITTFFFVLFFFSLSDLIQFNVGHFLSLSLSLSLLPSLPPKKTVQVRKPRKPKMQLKKGQKLKGVIDSIANFGIFVKVGEDSTGLLHRNEMPSDKASNLEESFKIGANLNLNNKRRGLRILLATNGYSPSIQTTTSPHLFLKKKERKRADEC